MHTRICTHTHTLVHTHTDLNKHTELFAPGGGGGGGIRRLLQLSEPSPNELYHASMIEKGKWKQLHRERELKKAVDEWEKKYGSWVSMIAMM